MLLGEYNPYLSNVVNHVKDRFDGSLKSQIESGFTAEPEPVRKLIKKDALKLTYLYDEEAEEGTLYYSINQNGLVFKSKEGALFVLELKELKKG